MLETPDEQWHTAQPEGGEDVPIRLQPQTSPLAEADFLPDDGLVLYDDSADNLAFSKEDGTAGGGAKSAGNE